MTDLADALERARGGGPQRHHEKSEQQGKLPVRERVARLVDEGSFTEDALLANWEEEGFGADGVVTGMAQIAGRPVCLMANDPTVKAGSWGPEDRREDHPDPGAGARRTGCRWSTSSTPRERGSPSRCRCSPAAATPGASSTPR